METKGDESEFEMSNPFEINVSNVSNLLAARRANVKLTLDQPKSAMLKILAFLLALSGYTLTAVSGDVASAAAIRAAIAKSLPLLEGAAKGSMAKRKQCFTCHNQGLPIMALTAARERGFAIDEENYRSQIQFTFDFLAKNRTNYLAGRGQGGQALTAGYALWTLGLGGWKPDTLTDAVAEYLLKFQSDSEHWRVVSQRPPSELSHFTVSYVALRGLNQFGTGEQKDRIVRRKDQLRTWMLKTPAKDTEDRAFRIWGLRAVDAAPEELRRASRELIETQRDDGGWAQLAEMTSDAYATGTALVALHLAGGLPPSDPAYHRGLQWLLTAQLDDGSWHVRTRSEPIQTYYESGYPHGSDQFISITAAGWSTTALAFALPKDP